MNTLSLVLLPLTTILSYGIPFLAALTVIVFVHEFGHFQVARWCGVTVEAFSIGFGREIAGWNDRHGTRWKLCWIPLGGYVKFLGDANPASLPDAQSSAETLRDPGNFHGKPVWQRAAVVVAGPLANFILAIAIFAAMAMFVGRPFAEPRVAQVMQGSPAEKAGFLPGDLILAIDGKAIGSFDELQRAVMQRAGERMSIDVDRGGASVTIVAVPATVEESDGLGGKMRIGQLGIRPSAASFKFEKLGLLAGLSYGVDQTRTIIGSTFNYLGKMVKGRESGDQLRGPYGIAEAAGKAAAMGPAAFVWFIAFLSVGVGMINLFPIPVLDGGHLVYLGIEALRGKPLGANAQEWGFRVGLSLVLLLMVFVTSMDILRRLS